MVVPAHVAEGAAERDVVTVGVHVTVRFCRGRLAARTGTVVQVHAFEGVSQGRVIAVRWDDDGSVSLLVPGADIEVSSP